MGHSLCSFILRQIPRRSPTHNAVYFTTTRLGGYNLRCSKACKPNSNSNALSILSLDDVALDYDGAIKTYTGSGTDLVIGMEGAALYASSPNALEVLLGEALAKTWANRYNKNTDIVL